MNIEIINITDRSDSMEDLVPHVIKAHNDFLKDQRAAGHLESMLTHVLFGSNVEELYAGLPLFAAPQLSKENYSTEGMTALYDALGQTLRDQKARIDSENWADKVIVTILTDGDENCSRYFSQAQVRRLVHECMQAGWQFLFLGASRNNVLAAEAIGLDPSTVSDFKADPDGLRLAYKKITSTVLALGYEG